MMALITGVWRLFTPTMIQSDARGRLLDGTVAHKPFSDSFFFVNIFTLRDSSVAW